jgi:hypothetical protein
MADDHGALLRQLFPILLILVVVARVALRNRKPRPLKIELMWIRPAIFLALAVVMLVGVPPPLTVIGVGSVLLAVALGVALGWQRGRLIRIEVHPETHEVMQRASPAALIFVVAVIALRYGARSLVVQGVGADHLPINLVTDTLGLFAISMVVTQSAEMWLRARRLLAEARAVKVSA